MIETVQKLRNLISNSAAAIRSGYNVDLGRAIRELYDRHPNTFVQYGRKVFSQADEDGITFEILRRLDIKNGTFAEFGVGDGTENNTLSLLAAGWRGFWVGGEDLAFNASGSKRLSFFNAWVTRENIIKLYLDGIETIKCSQPDVISLDLDGNDLYLCRELLVNNSRPSLFIVEYNGKFIPPIRFSIKYDPRHVWKHDDYTGASFMSFVDLFEEFDYYPVCCNAATGSNAFFVKKEYIDRFPEVPRDVSLIFSPPHYFLYQRYAHPTSKKTVETVISD